MGTYAKSARTKAHIFEVARSLFLEQGYAATSLRDIAKAAGVSTGTLYRHYPSKADVLFQMQRNSLDRLRAEVECLPCELDLVDKILRLVELDVETLMEGVDLGDAHELSGSLLDLSLATRREMFASLEALRREEEFRRELRAIYEQPIVVEQKQGRLDPDIDPALLSMGVAALYFQFIDQMYLAPDLKVDNVMRPRLAMLLGPYLQTAPALRP